MHKQALLHLITRQLCDRKFQDREMFGTSEHFTPSLSATAGPVALCMWIGFGCQEQMHALQGSLVLERPLISIRKNRALQELVQRCHPFNEAVSWRVWVYTLLQQYVHALIRAMQCGDVHRRPSKVGSFNEFLQPLLSWTSALRNRPPQLERVIPFDGLRDFILECTMQ